MAPPSVTQVETGEVVWASSAYPARTYEPKILDIEVADCLITRTYDSVRSEIEQVNRDLKCFYFLKNEFRSFDYNDQECWSFYLGIG